MISRVVEEYMLDIGIDRASLSNNVLLWSVTDDVIRPTEPDLAERRQ